MHNNILTFNQTSAVPRRVLKDHYDSPSEADEPQQSDLEHDPDELYDDDQFYKESEAIPPAPKLQGDLVTKDRQPENPSISLVSSIRPPLRARDESSLEGECLGFVNIIFVHHS